MRIDAPDIVLLDNFMTDAECDELCALSKGTLTNSTVVDDTTGKLVGHAERISQGTYFAIGQNALVKRIEARISEITSIPVSHGEGLQILNYVSGGEYRPHFDYFPDSEGGQVHTTSKRATNHHCHYLFKQCKRWWRHHISQYQPEHLSQKRLGTLFFILTIHWVKLTPKTLHGGCSSNRWREMDCH